MTMEGTVKEIRGYPWLFLMREASSPAVKAPINAAAAAGIPVKSTSSSRSVLAAAPMKAAVDAIRNRAVKHYGKAENPAEAGDNPQYKVKQGIHVKDCKILRL